MCQELRRFPWPAEPGQRYGLGSPWLAVVNARGPWGVWQHQRKGPHWLPWCRSLWSKAFWRQADDGLKVFCWEIWQAAADEDYWGIVWGDPVRLCRAWGLSPATFTERLEAMLAAGLVVYLSDAEREAAMAWRPTRSSRGEGGKPEGGRGESGKRGEGTGTGTGTEDRDRDRDSAQQIPDPSARAMQISDSREGQGQTTGTGTGTGTATVTGTAAQGHSESPQPAEPASLPKSDRRAGPERAKATGDARGLHRDGRPGAVSRRGGDAQPVGEMLAWSDPRAVQFGRRMYAAVHGREAPPDLTAATDADKADVGVWVHWWYASARPALGAGQVQGFEDRCAADVAKKRKCRGVRNLGGLARKAIVPGILASMVGK